MKTTKPTKGSPMESARRALRIDFGRGSMLDSCWSCVLRSIKVDSGSRWCIG